MLQKSSSLVQLSKQKMIRSKSHEHKMNIKQSGIAITGENMVLERTGYIVYNNNNNDNGIIIKSDV